MMSHCNDLSVIVCDMMIGHLLSTMIYSLNIRIVVSLSVCMMGHMSHFKCLIYGWHDYFLLLRDIEIYKYDLRVAKTRYVRNTESICLGCLGLLIQKNSKSVSRRIICKRLP